VDRIPDDFHLRSQMLGHGNAYATIVFSGNGRLRARVPGDGWRLFLDGREAGGGERGAGVSLRVAAAVDTPSTLLAFRRSDTELTGLWRDLPWRTGARPPREASPYVSPNKADGFFNHVAGRGVLIGRLPPSPEIRLRGTYRMRDVSKSVGEGVVRINGREVLRVVPGERPFQARAFNVDLSAYAGQDILLEFASEGRVVGFGAADWISPRFVAGNREE
jgi:hypothetical protein